MLFVFGGILPFHRFRFNKVPLGILIVNFGLAANVFMNRVINGDDEKTATFTFLPTFIITTTFLYRIITLYTTSANLYWLDKNIRNPTSSTEAMKAYS